MLRLASSLVFKVRLAEKIIRPVTAACSFSCGTNDVINDFGVGAYHYSKHGGEKPACDVIYNKYWENYPGYKYFPVLAQALYAEGMKLLIEGENKKLVIGGADVSDLVQGIHKARDVIAEHLTRRARKINSSEEIAQVAIVAASGDRKIGELVLKAVEKVGSKGLIFISETKKSNYELDFDKGMKLDWGLISPFFFTNKKETCILRNPLVLIVDQSELFLVTIIQLVINESDSLRPLLVVANDIDKQEAGFLLLDYECYGGRIKFCVVKSLKPEENRKALMQDLAILTGGQIVTTETELASLPKMLGSCKKVIASHEDMVILGGSGGKADIEDRCKQLRSAMKLTSSGYEVKLLKERLAKLSRGVAVIKVGGTSKEEVVLKKRKVCNALAAVKAAMEEGILPGGGVALLHASKELDKLEVTNSGQKLGILLLQRVLKMPMYSIASASGIDGLVVEKLLEQDNPDLGYDPARGECVDMIQSGNVDPLKLILRELEDLISHFGSNIWLAREASRPTKLIRSSGNEREKGTS